MKEKVFFGLTVAFFVAAAIFVAVCLITVMVTCWHLHTVGMAIQLAVMLFITYTAFFGFVGAMLYWMRPGAN